MCMCTEMVHRGPKLDDITEEMNTEIDQWVGRLAILLNVDFESLATVTETNSFANHLFGLPHEEAFMEVPHLLMTSSLRHPELSDCHESPGVDRYYSEIILWCSCLYHPH